MTSAPGLSRRAFCRAVGGGIAVLVAANPAVLAQTASRLYPEDFNAYLAIGGDGRVTVFSGKIEMGQGVLTSQAQMLAEELGVPLAAVDMVLGDTDRCPWDMGTFGSLTTRMFGPALRAAGAQARATLLALGAARLKVPAARLQAGDGKVWVAGDPNRHVSYAELARGARLTKIVDGPALLRAAAEFQVMGRSPPRLDAQDKVTGAARFAGDLRLPGMLYARLLRPPAHGATLLRLDPSGAQAVPGARVVQAGELVAVLHPDPEGAAAALALVKAEWQRAASPLDQDNIFDHLVQASDARRTSFSRGSLADGRGNAARVFERVYRKGYVAHAPIEPHTALADVRGGRATVWASTQTPFPTRDLVASALGLQPQEVRVITPYVGGGFGGKSASRQAVEAARLSQAAGRPVQVAWTREEEFFFDTFDPAAVVQLVSGIDAGGRIALWEALVYGAGGRGSALAYDIPHARVTIASSSRPGLHPFATGPWRAPGANMNVFAVESQIDLMASAAGVDPIEFRLRHLSDRRLRRVLQTAATAFGWKSQPAPSRRGVGVACAIDAGSCVASIAQLRVDAASGAIAVDRIVCAQDMGVVVNPVGAQMQIEGGLVMGLGYVLSEELRFGGGAILDRNFDTYQFTRFAGAPRIEAVLVKNDELAPQGGGEPSITTTGAVIANAFFDATGVRVARLPMTPQRVRAALAGANP
ncbi:xanthine dehydrogenase family protein molybdopterin-binding subunit [Ramlibacter sp.]|uniref:xanthine dehydrogenase family protein molybdopterin-binding subunit n=1 Tax=Ramlibacter sp. TaxID=1917967 RepID=UPI002B5FDF88|nr:molybdopterin cofactor-binding domain-containing protein [Ramlibacter sp.]HWI81500.1 molybdopterin cofactor-binding domain-containing protein [Ramlibacter sp.]